MCFFLLLSGACLTSHPLLPSTFTNSRVALSVIGRLVKKHSNFLDAFFMLQICGSHNNLADFKLEVRCQLLLHNTQPLLSWALPHRCSWGWHGIHRCCVQVLVNHLQISAWITPCYNLPNSNPIPFIPRLGTMLAPYILLLGPHSPVFFGISALISGSPLTATASSSSTPLGKPPILIAFIFLGMLALLLPETLGRWMIFQS